jgi:serine phosphatase RsbU (regulator of sigma subunit)
MNSGRKRMAILIFTSLLVLTYVILVAWRAVAMNNVGWVGMMFVPSASPENKESSPSPIFNLKRGSVVLIFDGSPADISGLQQNDEVLDINGIPTHDLKRLQELTLSAKLGDTFIYRVKRGESELSIPLRLDSPLKARQIAIGLGANTFAALIFFLIGFFVYWKKPEDRRTLIFYLMSIVATGFFLGKSLSFSFLINALGSQQTQFIVGQIVQLLMGLVAAFLYFLLLLHFALVFPKERPVIKNHPYILRWLYGAPLLLVLSSIALGFELDFLDEAKLVVASAVVLFLFALTFFLLFKLWKTIQADGWKRGLISQPFTTIMAFLVTESSVLGLITILIRAFNLPKALNLILTIIIIANGLSFIFIFIYPVLTCVALYRSYRESGVEERNQVRWPLWGTIVAVGGSFLIGLLNSGLLAIFGFNRAISSLTIYIGSFNYFLYLLLPISFAFAILKYRLMDIDLIIKKTVVYTLITGIIGVLFFSLAGGLGGLLIKFAGVESQWVAVFSTLAIVAVFNPVRNRVQSFADRRFFQKRYDYPQALRALSQQILSATDHQALLKIVAEHLQQTLQNRAVAIFIRTARERTFTAAAKVGLPDDIIGRLKFEPDSKILGMLNGALNAPLKDLPEKELLKLKQANSALLAPVKLKGELLGFISLGNKLSDQDYDDEDKDFLTSVADQMAVSLDNLRMHEQEEDFEKAREIQQGLLPKQISQIEGYNIVGAWQPMRVVGGDYFDVLKFSDSKMGVCIADVVGKGMSAALLMSNLQATVKAFATDTMPPKELCEKVNRVICSNIASGKFITFFYCLLDSETKRLTYTNAGHNLPILLRRDSPPLRLDTGGAVLGVFRQWSYNQSEVELTSGDRLLLFTDGVTEAANAAEEEFGEERLIKLVEQNVELGAANLQKMVMEAVAEFSNGDFQDDVTLIVMAVE